MGDTPDKLLAKETPEASKAIQAFAIPLGYLPERVGDKTLYAEDNTRCNIQIQGEQKSSYNSVESFPHWLVFIKLKGLYQLVEEKRHLTDLRAL